MKIDLLIEALKNIQVQFLDGIRSVRNSVKEIEALEYKIKTKHYIGSVIIYRKKLKSLKIKLIELHKETIRYIDFLIKESIDEEQRMRLKKASLNSPEYNKIVDRIVK